MLSSASFGSEARPTILTGARMYDTVLTGANGFVIGPVDVGSDGNPVTLTGMALTKWFAQHGANEVTAV